MGARGRSQEIVRLLERDGWTIELLGNGHHIATHPLARRPITLPSTTGNPYTQVRVLTKAKRALRG